MKIAYTLEKADIKSSFEMYLSSLGHPVQDSDDFTINPDGTATVLVTQVSDAVVAAVVTSSQIQNKPTVAGSPTTLPPDPPYSITGRATIFGLNYDGSVDKSDNGDGFFGYNTRDKSLIGVAIPEEVLMATLGMINGTWRQFADQVLQWAKNNMPIVMVWSQRTGKCALASLVDVGPAASTGNALDRTYGLCEALGDMDNGICTYAIDVGGKPIELKGWPIK